MMRAAFAAGCAASIGAGAAPEASAQTRIPKAVKVARATQIPECALFVDAAAGAGGNGGVARPFRTLAAAVEKARPGAVICVAEGVYDDRLTPGEKHLTLAGGFQSGKRFRVRDSAKYVSKAEGRGGSFFRVADGVGPSGRSLTVIDGFEITGWSQAIVRDHFESQRFDITNNHIHGNRCDQDGLAGAGFSLNNVSGAISGNVIRDNSCWRGGGGALSDSLDENAVAFENNRVEDNEGVEPDSSHGGALYFFNNRLTVRGNEIVGNRVTGWGAGLFVGAFTAGGQHTNAKLSWNVYRGNRAGNTGGGLFCDDGAKCDSDHEIFDGNCGGNLYLDGGFDGSGPTLATFDHMTNVNARAVGCGEPGPGVRIDKAQPAHDKYRFTNSIFWNNGKNLDFATGCDVGCRPVTIEVSHSMVQRRYANFGLDVTFGAGIVRPQNPRFADAEAGDFHLKSTNGRFKKGRRVEDAVDSPALAKGDPSGETDKNPSCAGDRTELGAYGNSREASCVR
jgi:hypothetical protein